ncbi:MAG: TonB-dependent receptor [Sphingomonas sp.]
MTLLRSSRAPLPTGTAFLALSCVGFLASAPAFAAEPANDTGAAADPANPADQITVTGRRDREPKQVATALNTPKSIVEVSSDVIQQTGSTTLADALRTIPGITFGAAEGGNPIGDRPFIRGFDSQGSIYVDGVRDLASQTREVFAVDSVQVVRGSDSTLGGRGSSGGTINIVSKLPTAETFAAGTASLGNADYKRVTGDVNVRLSDFAAFRVEALWHDQGVVGRDAIRQNRWGVAPSLTLGLNSPTRLTVGFYHLESHELPDSGLPFLYTIANAPGTGNIYTSPALGKITTISGATGYVDRSTFYGLANRDFRDAVTNQATIRAEHDFGGITLRNTARYNRSTQAYIFLLPDDSQGNVFGTDASNPATAGGQVWRRANTRYGYTESIIDQTDLFGTFSTGSISHSFAAGAEFSWEKARRGAFVLADGRTLSPRCTSAAVARYNCTSLFTPNPNDPWVNYVSDTSSITTPITRQLPIQETQNDAETQSVYGFDSITLLPSLILNVGARFDHFKSTVQPGQAVTAVAPYRLGRSDNLFNWQAGLVFKPTRETSLYASYATAATPPNSVLGEGRDDNSLGTTQNQAFVDALKPQKTRTWEVGAKGSLFREKLALAAAVFQTETSNARVIDADNNVSFIGKTRIRGVELTANGTILPGWTVFGGYTFLDARIVDGGFTALAVPAFGARAATTALVPSVNTGKQVPQTARNSLTLWTNVTPVKRLSFGAGAFFMDRQFGGYADNRAATQDAAGTITVNPATKTLYRYVPSYWRFDLRAAYQLGKHHELSVNVQNLTDKAYFNQVYTSHYASIAAGRTVFATLSVKY